MAAVNNPHDKLFKEMSANPRAFREFLECNVPKEILQNIDLNRLEPEPTEFIGLQKERLLVDVLYKTFTLDNNEECYLYIIVEHQSTPDKFMPLRIIQYTLQIIQKHLNTNIGKDKVPFVLPMVFYHGERKYKYSNDINSLVDFPREIVDEYFLKPFQLIDVSKIADTELRESIYYGCAALIMKHIHEKNVKQFLYDIFYMMHEIKLCGQETYFNLMLEYIADEAKIDRKELDTIYHDVFISDLGDELMAMTLTEQYRQQGREQGREQGIIVMLQEGLDLEKISSGMNISMDELLKIKEKLEG